MNQVTHKMKWEMGAIVAIALAMIAFAFWLGHLEHEVADLNKNPAIDSQVNESIKQVKQAGEDVKAQIAQSSLSVEPGLDTVICNFDNPGCGFQVSNTQIVEKAFPVDTHGKKITAAWYVPVDAITYLNAFDHIEVSPGSDGKSVVLKAKGVGSIRGQVRIHVYCVMA
jgi:hypothetical protein